MSILEVLLGRIHAMHAWTAEMSAHRVVAFMVTVKLVEKRVNSRVGTDMVVSLSAMYRIHEIVCRIQSMTLARRPSQDVEL
jgi:uncharacterized heparinase superfamily protein